jgi:alpha-tubulin suppressor-like RCC1 family protein
VSKTSSGLALTSALFLAFSGCSSDATGPAVQIPAVLAPFDGDLQTAVVGTAVAKAPTVRLLDDKNAGVAGIVVTFAVSTGGGSITGAIDTTDATGAASIGTWTLGTAPGTNSLTATSGSLTATITATATVGRAFSITPVAGKDQSASVGTNVATAPAVAVRDTFANAVAGATVTFTVATGGGTVTGATAISDASGIATLGGWKLGTTVGANSLGAASGNLTASFNATAVAGAPAKLIIFPGTYAAAAIAQPDQKVDQQPNVIVSDAFNNPVPNVTVVFSVGASGGTFATSGGRVTNQYGVAYVDSWVLGSQPGDYTLMATVSTMSVTFHATATPSTPPTSSPPATSSLLRFSVLSTGVVGQSGGAYHTCALDTSGNAYCWGSNASGELGDGTTVSSSVPVRVVGGLTFVSLAGGTQHTCGLTAGGAAYCWGSASSGALGDSSGRPHSTPNPVSGGLTFKSIAAGYSFTCALTLDGKAYCWGSGFLGRMGDGGQTDHRTPTAVSGGLTFASLAVGFGHACGLTSAGKAYCWGGGSPYWGQLGNGVQPVPDPDRPADDPLWVRMSTTPTAVSGGLSFTQLAAGFATTCGLEISGKVYCWGLNTYGGLGDGTRIARGVPTAVLGSPAYVSVSVGGYQVCGMLQSGAVRCSGANFYGQFGNGYLNNSLTPIDAAMGMTFVNISAGDFSACGIDSSQKIYCWGNNDYGQLGDGTTTRRTTPVAVLVP